jgi:YbbR domain-containing protein
MRAFFAKNTYLKILSILLAISLWFYVTYRGESEISMEVPLEFKNVPSGLEILRQSHRRVTINIQGHEQAIHRLRPSDIHVFVDMSGAKKGENQISLDKDNVLLPQSLKIQRIDPSSIKTVLDETVSRVVSVRPYITGVLDKPYVLTAIKCSPAYVRIEGPKSEVERISLIRTDPIDITGVDDDMTQTVKLNLNGRAIRPEVSEITVTLTIRKGSS